MTPDPTTAPDDKRRREAADDYVKGMINKSPTAYYGFLEGCAHEARHQVLRSGGEGIGQVYGLTNCSVCKELTNDYRFVGKGYLCPKCFDEFPALLAKLAAEIKLETAEAKGYRRGVTEAAEVTEEWQGDWNEHQHALSVAAKRIRSLIERGLKEGEKP